MSKTKMITITGIVAAGLGISSLTGLDVAHATGPATESDPGPPQPIVSATTDFSPTNTPATVAKQGALPSSDPKGESEATALADVAGWRAKLLAQFPDSFGGMYNRGDNSYVVLAVGDGTGITQWVKQQATSMTVDNLPVPSVSIGQSPISLATLQAYASKITAAIPVGTDGLHLGGAGVDEKSSQVVVYTVGTPTTDVAPKLAARFGGPASLYKVLPLTHPGPLDRVADSPPWNAGDVIWDATGAGVGCTTGFGVHNASGHYLLTAGHCGNRTWKNTFPSSIVGSSIPSTIQAPSVGHNDWDMQLINANGGSSDLFWKETATREYVASAASPIYGDPVCGEGAFGLESCGTISNPNTSLCLQVDPFTGTCDVVLLSAFVVQGETPTHGDSGGPMVQVANAPYSYVAKGTIDADASNGGSNAVAGEAINAELYLEGVQINTPSNP